MCNQYVYMQATGLLFAHANLVLLLDKVTVTVKTTQSRHADAKYKL